MRRPWISISGRNDAARRPVEVGATSQVDRRRTRPDRGPRVSPRLLSATPSRDRRRSRRRPTAGRPAPPSGERRPSGPRPTRMLEQTAQGHRRRRMSLAQAGRVQPTASLITVMSVIHAGYVRLDSGRSVSGYRQISWTTTAHGTLPRCRTAITTLVTRPTRWAAHWASCYRAARASRPAGSGGASDDRTRAGPRRRTARPRDHRGARPGQRRTPAGAARLPPTRSGTQSSSRRLTRRFASSDQVNYGRPPTRSDGACCRLPCSRVEGPRRSSTTSNDATPAQHAHVHARLLDNLAVDRALVIRSEMACCQGWGLMSVSWLRTH